MKFGLYRPKFLARLGLCAVLGGMFMGGMAFLVQGQALGFGNVRPMVVLSAFLVGAAAALAVAYLIIKKEGAIRESEARFRAVIDNAADAIITIDDNGFVESLSPSAEKIFGYRAEEIIGRNVSVLMTGPDAGRHHGYINNYLETGESKILGKAPREVTGKTKDGSEIPLELSVGEMWVNGRRLFIGGLRDISARKKKSANWRRNRPCSPPLSMPWSRGTPSMTATCGWSATISSSRPCSITLRDSSMRESV